MITSDDYELIDHTADIGIRVWGDTRKVLFASAGRAMFDLITDRRQVRPDRTESVIITGIDLSDLLINWLRELLFFWTGKAQLIHSVEVESLSDKQMTGRVSIAPYESDRHVIRHEIKAVTYHQAEVKPVSDGWGVAVIFDV